MEISNDYIMPGLNKSDLGITTENRSEMELKLQQVGEYERNTLRAVK